MDDYYEQKLRAGLIEPGSGETFRGHQPGNQHCEVCRASLEGRRSNARVCGGTCRKRLHRAGHSTPRDEYERKGE